MAKLQIFIYFLQGQVAQYGLTENGTWCKERYPNGYLLTPPLPCDQAFVIYRELQNKSRKISGLFRFIPTKYQQTAYLKFIRLGFLGFPVSLAEIPAAEQPFEHQTQAELAATITQVLAGRIIEDRLLVDYLRKAGWWPAQIFRVLEDGYQQGYYKFFPGIIHENWGVSRCARCNSLVTEAKPCYQCGRNDCAYCEHCQSLGEIRACSRLWTLTEQNQTSISAATSCEVQISLSYSLTEAQRQASEQLVQFLQSDQNEILVWAACGAGKTEVSFGAIQKNLEAGEQVLFAIPRRDVVIELAERLQKNFPNTSIAVHYGGQPWKSNGQLVVATTHQALRFYHRFALIILDESDAFPYQGSEMLRFAIQRGKKPGGKLIEMTATPVRLPSNYITIPARYHGYPLPEPKFLKKHLPNWDALQKQNLPLELLTTLVDSSAPWLVFVPTIAASKQVGKYLSANLKIPVCSCYASDPARDEKKAGLLTGQYRVMVSTSIMERGITIPNIQVAVLYCDHPVFTTNSLIQMAGRVGRTQQFPKGKVLFIGQKSTNEIKTAIARIRYLNKQAAKQDLLKEITECGLKK